MTGVDASPERWFLTAEERGNPQHVHRPRPRATRGRTATTSRVLVDGAEYFPCLLDEIRATGAGDWLYLTDLEGNGDERLSGPGTEIGTVLADAARRGVAAAGPPLALASGRALRPVSSATCACRAPSTMPAVSSCSTTGSAAAGATIRRSS